jgi:type I restriction enzyme S subunit
MIRDLPPYPAYKDSGVPWLGKVPEHWKVLPGRTVFREINDRGHPGKELLSVTITRGVLRQADLLADSSKKDSSNEDKSNYKLVQPGDLVYNKMRAWQGALGVSNYRGIVSPAYIVQRLRSSENLPRYIHFVLRTPLFTSEAERWSYGITSDQWSLRGEEFKCIYFSLPPLPEQTAIVRFLDYMDRRIRRSIRAKQKLIKLLEEYRQSLIHRAVTGKIDVRTGQPYPSYKDSGVPWLGQVPEHWELAGLRYLTSCLDGRRVPLNAVARGNMQGPYPYWGANKIIDFINDYLFDEPLVLLGEDGAPFFEANKEVAFFVEDKIWVNNHAHVLRCKDRLQPRYLVHVLNLTDYTRFVDGSTRDKLTQQAMGSIPIILPRLDEQTAIVEYLDAQTAKLDAAIAVARREIELLREYRERLIADVVIGKVDVRQVAAQLPEEPPDQEAELIDTDEIAESEGTEGDAAAEALPEEGVEA